MAPKTNRKQKGIASKRQCIRKAIVEAERVVFEPEVLGNVWKDNIFPFVQPRHLLKLPATCKFFKQLFESLDNGFWTGRCKALGYSLKGVLAAEPKRVFISNTLQRCYLCHSKTKSHSDLARVFICMSCRGRAPFETISPTMSQKVFHLKRQDLNGLNYIVYRNSHRQDCELYLRSDVEARAYAHYGSKEAWLAVDAKSQARKVKLAEGRAKGVLKRQAEKQARKEKLVAALNSKGLELRSDSQLCENFIDGDTDLTIKEIVYIMFQMKIIHEECDFEEKWDEYYEENFARDDDYDDFWGREYREYEYDRHYIHRERQEMQEDLFDKWIKANPERYQAFLKM